MGESCVAAAAMIIAANRMLSPPSSALLCMRTVDGSNGQHGSSGMTRTRSADVRSRPPHWSGCDPFTTVTLLHRTLTFSSPQVRTIEIGVIFQAGDGVEWWKVI
jgi:hypothetical protein